ncbi:hypothetical protein BJ165DRAFT_1510697 [Panaeolus papilionaceus]|nr:hypothetical protein BJ165DRAFT_1510697 [Panaeolus papilionaceus]
MGAEFDRTNKLVTSWLLNPCLLAFIRYLIAFYTLATLLVSIIRSATAEGDAGEFFSFFTNLTYIGICAYFFASAVQTTFFALNSRSGRPDEGYPLKEWPRVLRYLHVLLLTTVTTFPILVTIVFWLLLSTPSTLSTPFAAWSNISKHALNTVFALFEIIFTNIGPFPWIDLPVAIVILGMYLGLGYLTKATQDFYPYSFLNPKKQGKKLAIYIVGIPVGYCIVFCIVFGIIKLRQRLTKGKGETTEIKSLTAAREEREEKRSAEAEGTAETV